MTRRSKKENFKISRPQRILVLCAVVAVSFGLGRGLVWAQVWTRPAAKPPINNAGQPVTISNPFQYLLRTTTTRQLLQGSMIISQTSKVPAELANPTGTRNISVYGRNSFAPPPAYPTSTIGIFGYSSGSEYGIYGTAEGSGPSYGIVGRDSGSGSSAAQFYGPVSVATNGSALGTFLASGTMTADGGFQCLEASGCVIAAATTGVSATSTAGIGVYGFGTTNRGISININDAVTENGRVVQGFSNLGYGVAGYSSAGSNVEGGISGVVAGTNVSKTYIGVAGYANSGSTATFLARKGVYGLSSGGLGDNYTAQVGGTAGPIALDSTGIVGFYTSEAIAAGGLPVISYYDSTNGDLKVLKCSNTFCSSGNTITTVDSAGTVGGYSSIAVGASDLPVISYYDNTNFDLKVLKCGNASCSSGNTITTVDSAGSVGSSTSLAIGAGDLPVISYYDITNGDLKVLKCGNASCSSGNTITAVDTTGTVGSNTSVAIGAGDLPVISYADTGNFDLKVAKCGNASCSSGNVITTVDTAGSSVGSTSIAIGAGDLPVISYWNGSVIDLKVAKCGNAACSSGNTITTVDAGVSLAGRTPSINIPSDGLPVVSYSDNANGELQVLKCGNATCSSGNTITYVDTAGNVGDNSSLEIGSDNLPVISYYDGTNGDLKFVKCADQFCTPSSPGGFLRSAPVDSTGDTGRFSALAVGTGNLPIIAYWDATNMDLKVTKCGNTTCTSGNTISSPDTTGDTGRWASIAMGSSDLAVVAYYNNSLQDLKVLKCGNATCNSGNTVTTVDSTGNVGGGASVAVASGNLPVISYYDITNGDLKVAKCGNATCSSGNTITAVDTTGTVGSNSSLALGSDGFPVISYLDTTTPFPAYALLKVLKCGNATCTSGNSITTLDTTGVNPLYLFTAVPADGLPIIAFYDSNALDLLVIKCGNASCSSGNTKTIIDATGFTGQEPSIVFGTNGLPIISYNFPNSGANGDLRVIACGNAACSSGNTMTDVDQAGYTGIEPSIGIGADGLPVISYYSSDGGDLRVVKCLNASCTDVPAGTGGSSVAQYDLPAGVRACLRVSGSGAALNKIGVYGSGGKFAGYFDGAQLCAGAVTVTVDSASEVGGYNSVAIGTDGLPIISYYDYAPGTLNLKVVKCGNESCSSGNTFTTVDSTGDVGGHSRIAVPASGLPVISYWDYTNTALKVVKCGTASCSSGNTITTVVNTSDNQGTSDLELDSSGIPVITYPDNGAAGTRGLWIVRCLNVNCTGSPTPIRLDSTANAGNPSSLMMLPGGLPAVMYQSGQDVKYIKCLNAGCSTLDIIRTIDAFSGSIIVSNEIVAALGTDNKPIVVYHEIDGGARRMRVAKCTVSDACSSGIVISPVDPNSTINLPDRFGMTVPADGKPVIALSEFNVNGGTLDVQKCVDANCTATTLVRRLSTSSTWFVSMVLSPTDGFPIIVNGNASIDDLFVTKCVDATCSEGQSCTPQDAYDGGHVMISSGVLRIGTTYVTKKNMACLLKLVGYTQYSTLCP